MTKPPVFWGLGRVLAVALLVARPVAAAPADLTFAAGARPQGYKLGLLAVACWTGGVWADGEGPVLDEAARGGRTEQHCRDLAATVWGSYDGVRLEQVRALEQQAVDDVVAKALAAASPRERPDLDRLLHAFAAAAREGMYVRRDADKVKRDLDERHPARLSKEELAALPAFKAHGALQALLTAKSGDFSRDAHALGLILAMDRMEAARGLGKTLKVYAVRDAFALVFGAPAPPASVPEDPRDTLPPGVWLGYLTQVAAAAGHPVPATAASQPPRQRELLAWGGVLGGFADRLNADVERLSSGATPELTRVLRNIARRLSEEAETTRRAAAAKGQSARM